MTHKFPSIPDLTPVPRFEVPSQEELFRKPKYSSKLFLIGNGFDLGHGLKTGYADFIKWYLLDSFEKTLKANDTTYNDNCFTIKTHRKNADPTRHGEAILEVETALKHNDISEYIVKSTNMPQVIIPSGNGLVRSKPDVIYTMAIFPENDFMETLLKSCFKADWSGIENEIYSFLKSELHLLKRDNYGGASGVRDHGYYEAATERVLSLNKSVKCLKEKLKEYLITQNDPDISRNWFDSVLTELLRKDYVRESLGELMMLNFNYTTFLDESDTVKSIKSDYGKFFHLTRVNHIHGSLDDKNVDDIVFGVGDEANGFYEEVERECGNEWLECMKSFNYFRNNRYKDLLNFINGPLPYEIYIMGHSCSVTDRTLLKMIFEHENCKSINIFHYNGMDSYMKTAYNVARNFSDKVKMRNIVQPYNPNLSMK